MIEGVRLLPWFQESARKSKGAMRYLSDCKLCMEDNPEEIRRMMGCGFIPDAPAPSTKPNGCELEVSVCVGYTTKLPEVAEVTRARMWWDKAQLREWCDGEEPTAPLRACIEELEIQYGAVQSFKSEEMMRKAER